MVDYGLIGAFGEGLQSYNKASSDAQDRAIKKRQARAQEVEAAAKMADVTGEVPSDLYPSAGSEKKKPVDPRTKTPVTGDFGAVEKKTYL